MSHIKRRYDTQRAAADQEADFKTNAGDTGSVG